MSRLLVVQPDSVQADALREALHGRVSEDVTVAESLDDALSSLDQSVPDVVLLPTLLPGAVEDYLIAYLGTIPNAGYVQILGLPRLERSDELGQRGARSLFPWRQREESRTVGTQVCDPGVFTEDLIIYLVSAMALKKEIELRAAEAVSSEGQERRREPRFASNQVPWISHVSFGGERAALINVSSRGALLRTRSRPEHHVLRRSDSNAREGPRLTLALERNGEVHAMGRVIRCVPLKTSGPTQYEIALVFDYSVGLYLPATDALVPILSDTNKGRQGFEKRGDAAARTFREIYAAAERL
jgi:CheY-like chemotaxis protein